MPFPAEYGQLLIYGTNGGPGAGVYCCLYSFSVDDDRFAVYGHRG